MCSNICITLIQCENSVWHDCWNSSQLLTQTARSASCDAPLQAGVTAQAKLHHCIHVSATLVTEYPIHLLLVVVSSYASGPEPPQETAIPHSFVHSFVSVHCTSKAACKPSILDACCYIFCHFMHGLPRYAWRRLPRCFGNAHVSRMGTCIVCSFDQHAT